MSRDFRPLIFCPKDSKVPGPFMNRLKWFFKLFHFHEDIRLQSPKFACPRSQRTFNFKILVLCKQCNPPCLIVKKVAIGNVNTFFRENHHENEKCWETVCVCKLWFRLRLWQNLKFWKRLRKSALIVACLIIPNFPARCPISTVRNSWPRPGLWLAQFYASDLSGK